MYLEDLNQKRWVELPDCEGKPGEVALKSNIFNGNLTYGEAPSGATQATCKKRPGVSTDKSAEAALDSMTPKAD